MPVVIAALAYLVTHVFLSRTVYGRDLYAIGGNREAARLCGIPVDRRLNLAYALSGAAAALAAIVLAARMNSGIPAGGHGRGAGRHRRRHHRRGQLLRGRGHGGRHLIGALIIGFLRNGLNLLDVSAFWQMIVIGVVIVVAVWIDVLRQRVGRTAHEGDDVDPDRAAVMAVCASPARRGASQNDHPDPGASAPPKEIEIALGDQGHGQRVLARHGGRSRGGGRRPSRVKLSIVAPDREINIDQQVTILEDQTRKGVKALVVSPAGSAQILSALEQATQRGVPVILVDTDAPFDKKVTYIGTNNRRGGQLAAKGLADAIGGPAEVALISGVPGNESQDETRAGIHRRPRLRLPEAQAGGPPARQQRARARPDGHGEHPHRASRNQGRLRHQRPDGAGCDGGAGGARPARQDQDHRVRRHEGGGAGDGRRTPGRQRGAESLHDGPARRRGRLGRPRRQARREAHRYGHGAGDGGQRREVPQVIGAIALSPPRRSGTGPSRWSARVKVTATVTARCGGCSWASPALTAAMLVLEVDGHYAQHQPLTRGEGPRITSVLLGRFAAGPHRLSIRLDRGWTPKAVHGVAIPDVRIATTTEDDPDFRALAYAPVLHPRPNELGRFTDVPLVMWYETDATARGTRIRYSVIFSNEDGGTLPTGCSRPGAA